MYLPTICMGMKKNSRLFPPEFYILMGGGDHINVEHARVKGVMILKKRLRMPRLCFDKVHWSIGPLINYLCV